MAGVAPWLIALPLVGAAFGRVPVLSRVRGLDDAITIACGAGVAALAVWSLPSVAAEPTVHWVGGWQPRDGLVIGVPLVADVVSLGFVALAGVLTTAIAVYVLGDYERLGGLFHVVTLLLLAALNGFVLSGDLFTMFVFVELVGIAIYALTAYKVDDVGTIPAAFAIGVTSTIGAVVFLTGVTSIYAAVGTPNLAEVAVRLDGAAAAPALVVAAGLFLAGLSAKAGLVPFHFSHADSHTAAMVPHAALFGALTVPAALYGMARLLATVLAPLDAVVAQARTVLLALALLTALLGAVMALVQTHLKRLLAFSSIAHLGIAGVGVGLGSPTGLAGSMLYVAGHGSLKVALFLAVGVVLHRLGTVELGELTGRWREVPGATALLAVGAPLLAGAAPGGLHLGKVGIEAAATGSDRGAVMVVVYLAAALTGAAVVRAVVHLVAGWPAGPDPEGTVAEGQRETTRSAGTTPALLVAVPAVLIALCVTLPFLPQLGDGAVAGAQRFLDVSTYTALVVDDVVAPGAHGSPWPGTFTAASVAKGSVAGVAAIALGIAAAHDRPSTRPTRLAAPLRWVRRWHSGHFGDYAAWATAGAAVWAVVLLVTVA